MTDKYIRDLRHGSAILIEKNTDKLVAVFYIEDFDNNHDKMRIACDKKWDDLLIQENIPKVKLEQKNFVQNVKQERAYNGFFKMDLLKFDQTRFNGEVMNDVVREVFIRKPVVFLSLFDPKNKVHLFTKQVRVGAIVSEESDTDMVIEPIAGIIDDGETALEAAVREAKEETGIDINIESIKVIQKGFTTPGGSSEFAYFATGLFNSEKYTPQTGGLEGEQEDISTSIVSHKQALEMIKNGEINSLSASFGVYWHSVHS